MDDQRPDRIRWFAHEIVFDKVEAYFADGSGGSRAKVHRTAKAPLYLQHRTHSLTIVGAERRTDGTRNLLVFDPMYHTPEGMQRLLDRGAVPPAVSERFVRDVLLFYRRADPHLHKYDEFEILS